MTRKDYELISAIFKAGKRSVGPQPGETLSEAVQTGMDLQFNTLAFGISLALAADNPHFDRDRFLKACGVTA